MPDLAATRDAVLAQQPRTRIPSPFAARVVGVSSTDGYPHNLLVLEEIIGETPPGHQEPIPAVLIRDPDNPHDPNAVQVHVPTLGSADGMVGHLTRPVAARVAPELDSGVAWSATVEAVHVHPDHLDQPGITIQCRRITENT